jgi:hypothetical protein
MPARLNGAPGSTVQRHARDGAAAQINIIDAARAG